MNKNSMNKTPVFALKLATFVIALGYSLIIPVMPFYMKNLGAGGKELGWLTAIYALTQTLCAPFWGVLSDRIGRKPIISIGIWKKGLVFVIGKYFCHSLTAFTDSMAARQP